MTGEGCAGGRTHMCGALRAEEAGERVVLAGWVAQRRATTAGSSFLDLRDREGIVQVVAHPEEAPEAHRARRRGRSESVVRVSGTVRPGRQGP